MPFPDSSLVRGGKYELIRPQPIGMGGLGQVYHAREVGLDCEVAVKEVLPSLGSERRQQAAEKFRQEARLHGRLKHAHIVLARTLETDAESGEQYLVCEFVAGGSLAELLQRGPLPEPVAVRLTLDLLDALEYLHNRHLIHRDLKPSNILLATDAEGQIAWALLADFGLVRNLRAVPTTIGPGLVPSLTPEYCAPEQTNPTQLLDARTDLYAVGLVLAEMLLGQGPYKLALHSGAVRPPVRRRLARVIMRATEEVPQRRYQSAHEFRRDLLVAARYARTERSYSLILPVPRPDVRSRLALVLATLSVTLFLSVVPLLVLSRLAQQPLPIRWSGTESTATPSVLPPVAVLPATPVPSMPPVAMLPPPSATLPPPSVTPPAALRRRLVPTAVPPRPALSTTVPLVRSPSLPTPAIPW